MYRIDFNMLRSTQPWQDGIFMTSIKYLTIGSMLKIVQDLMGLVRTRGLPFCCLTFLRHFSEVGSWARGLRCLWDSIQELLSALQKYSPQVSSWAATGHNSRARRSAKKWEAAKLRASKGFLLGFSKLRKIIPQVRLGKDLVLIHINKSVSSCYSEY